MQKNNFLSIETTTQIRGCSILLILLGHMALIHGNFPYIGAATFLIISGFGLINSYQKNGLDGFFRK
jgi:peptidoglycan/LPS O-acetylase OafA/YrhL